MAGRNEREGISMNIIKKVGVFFIIMFGAILLYSFLAVYLVAATVLIASPLMLVFSIWSGITGIWTSMLSIYWTAFCFSAFFFLLVTPMERVKEDLTGRTSDEN